MMTAEQEVKECLKCGESKPHSEFYRSTCTLDGLRGSCKACIKSAKDEWRENNRERYSSTNRVHYLANKAKKLSAERKKRQDHPEKWAEFYKKNSEKRKAYSREYRRKNPLAAEAARKSWRAKNPERARLSGRLDAQKRRLAKGAGTFSAEQWRAIVDMQLGRCIYCGKKCDKLEIEHLVPLVKGGAHSAENIAAACLPCNRSKHAKDQFEFALARGRLLW